ncbi:DgyrCDS10701 [Dimorphilus gyrociliatus]|uniref:protein-ribulosamine 3-kinase n=1 Tax=Dimorphilus gyrociliatus TaxID=2664684 RepID=A0A7I8W624_9ANNE|nr:DgyrCDS10701 [Dimorphilus gyrociliatus]
MTSYIETILKKELNCSSVEFIQRPSQDSINNTGVYNTSFGPVFVKENDFKLGLDMFQVEEESLKLIKETGTIRVPNVLKVIDKNERDGAIIVLEYLNELKPIEGKTSWMNFAKRVARLHKDNINKLEIKKKAESSIHNKTIKAIEKFGFHFPIVFGPIYQIQADTWYSSWPDLYLREILNPMINAFEPLSGQSEKNKKLYENCREMMINIDKVFKGYDYKPSLCVSDLASDNCGEIDGEPIIYDPYCSYSHHEFDFTQPLITNDFPPEFYQAYDAEFGARRGSKDRSLAYRLFGHLIRANHDLDREENIEKGLELTEKLIDLSNKS